MKHLRPGQLMMYHRRPFRAKKATQGCEGCDLNNISLCPRMTFANNVKTPNVHCMEDGIIFERIPINL